LLANKLNKKKVYTSNTGKPVYQHWVTIPEKIVEESGIDPGSRLSITVSEDAIILRKNEDQEWPRNMW